MQILSLIRERFESALNGWVKNPLEHVQRITPARDPQHGDYQANIAMPLKAEIGKALTGNCCRAGFKAPARRHL